MNRSKNNKNNPCYFPW